MYPIKSVDIVPKDPGLGARVIKSHKLISKSQAAKVFKDFCESTSLHGYNYLYIANSVILKILWIIVIVAATFLGIVFLVSNTNDYLEARIVTTIESSSASLSVSSFPEKRYKFN